MASKTRRSLARGSFVTLVVTLLTAAGTGGGVAGAQTRDETPKHYFTVEIEGLAAGSFRSVSGLSVETEVIEYTEGGSKGIIYKLPGRVKYPNIVLTRGFAANSALYEWATEYARTGNVTRRSGVITVYTQSGETVARYHFTEAWPVKWEGPTLDAGGNKVAVETLEIAHAGFRPVDADIR